MKTKTQAFVPGVFVAVAFLSGCGNSSEQAPPNTPTGPTASSPAASDAADAGPAASSPPVASSPPAAEVAWETLVDFEHKPPKKAGEHKLLGKGTPCPGGAKSVTWTDDRQEGAFTTKGATEVVFLAHTASCDPKQPEKRRLVVTKKGDDKPIVDQEVPEGMLVEVRDLDNDGDNEILLMSETRAAAGAEKVTTARLVDTEDGKFETLYDFGEVTRNNCVSGGDLPIIKYRQIGKSMEYAKDKRTTPCMTK